MSEQTNYLADLGPAPVWPSDTLWAIEPSRMHTIVAGARSRSLIEAAQLGKAIEAPSPLQVEGGIAVIDIAGPLTKAPSLLQALFGWTSTEMIRQAVDQAAADDTVETIVLRIDSPGGSADGLAEAGDAIWEARQDKTVIAQITGMAASAAYYLASQADAIYAQRMDLIGSIGTRMMLYDFSKLFEEAGIKAIPIDTGPYKSAGAAGTEITEDQQSYFQGIVDAYFADFVKVVARGRRMSEAAVRDQADGRVYTASEALSRGLIDRIITYENALAQIRGGSVVRGPQAGPQESEKENEMAIKHAPAEHSAPAPPAEPKAEAPRPATVQELKQAFPGSDAPFRESCLEIGASIQQATGLWAKHVTERLGALQAENDALRSERDQLKSAVGLGVNPLPDSEPETGGESGVSAVARFEAAVRKKTDAGMRKKEAIPTVIREQPELHASYLKELAPAR